MRVSAVQYDVKHNTDENIKTINRLTENFDGNILVLPELCMSGYLFENRAELIKYSVPIPSDSKELNYLAALSSQKNCAVIAGLSEIDGEYIYNSAVVFDCGKYIGKYRIEEATRIISDTENDVPLKQLADELGFNSVSVFYKTFSKETGLTPGIFRKEAGKASKMYDK